jgi:MerR family mercuric resistance operon transcriptional regulator
MNACTLSKLACDAGVSVHVVRDYVVRGLLRPASHTSGGYGLYDGAALKRLRFVRAAFEAGISLNELRRLCHALDGGAGDVGECLAHLRLLISSRLETLALLDRQLARMAGPACPQAEAASHHV